MKSYCVRHKKKTECVPGSQRTAIESNGRKMLACVCAECGATKTRFMRGQTGGAVSKNDFACGYNLRGKRPGTLSECFNTGQIRQWGVNKLDDGQIDQLLRGRQAERNRKARERRQANKMSGKARVKTPAEKEGMLTNFLMDRPSESEDKPAVKKITKKSIKERIDELKNNTSGWFRDGNYFMMKFNDGTYGPSIYDPNKDELKLLKKTSKTDAVNIYYNLVNHGKKPAKRKDLVMPELKEFDMRPDLDEKYKALIENWDKMKKLAKPAKKPAKPTVNKQEESSRRNA